MGLACRLGRERFPCQTRGISVAAIIAGVIVTLPLMAGVALFGARRARRTQAGFCARIYLHRLPAEDRDAELALLDETAAARRAGCALRLSKGASSGFD